MPVKNIQCSGAGVVRWILVVSLGCSLGLLMVYAIVNMETFPPGARLASGAYGQNSNRRPEFSVSDKKVGDELARVVQNQLAAFRNEDYSRAYEFAADELRSQMPLKAFERMVKNRYPVIARSTSAKFGVMVDNGAEAVVNVILTGESGRSTEYQYFLQKQKQAWKIGGVAEIRDTSVFI